MAGLCDVQHHTLACLADVVDYFIAKVGPSARPLNVDLATLQQTEASRPSPAYSDAATVVGRSPSQSQTVTQFDYSNPAPGQTDTHGAGARLSLGSSGHSDTRSSLSSSPSDSTLHPVNSDTFTATAQIVSTSGITPNSFCRHHCRNVSE